MEHDEEPEPIVIPVRTADEREIEGIEEAYRRRRNNSQFDATWSQKIGYGFGHFENDLCASMWFTYLMVFNEKVLMLRSGLAGLLMLIGQATDAIATPIVGILSDGNHLPKFFDRIGRRMSFHVLGTIFVTFTFPFIYGLFLPSNLSPWWKVAWFTPFIVFFQIGWASVQIAHLALIPELSTVDSSRTTMNSLRYAAAVLANIAVFLMLFAMLSSDDEHTIIGPNDLKHFRTAALVVILVGTIVSLVFYALVREPPNRRSLSRTNSVSSLFFVRMDWTSWFRQAQFYQVTLLYTLSRLFVNVSQVYYPFFITITQNYSKHYVAIFPMVAYISSFGFSLFKALPVINALINKKILFCVGVLFGLCSCIWMHFSHLTAPHMYGIAVVLGAAQAMLLISSLAITTDLINRNTESSAFVFGAMSLADKLTNGIAYQLIELFNPNCTESVPDERCICFYRNVIVFIPGVCLLLAAFVLATLIPARIGHRSREEDTRPIIQEE